jgi:hypothetical protein
MDHPWTIPVIGGSGLLAGLLCAWAITRARPRHPASRPTRRPSPGGVGDRVTRLSAGFTTLALAAIAAAISYDHLRILAEEHGESGWRTHAFPLSVDGMEVIASLVLLADKRSGRRSARITWIVLLAAFAASFFANMAVAEPEPIARAIAAWPSVAFLAAIKLWMGLLEHPPAPTTPSIPRPTAGTTPHPDPHPAHDHVPQSITSTPSPGPTGPTGPTGPGAGRRDLAGRRPQTLPVDVLRRVPADQAAYDRWRRLWARLRHEPDASTKDVAARHGIHPRQAQWIRAVGATGLLDDPTPPAYRLLDLIPPAHGGDQDHPEGDHAQPGTPDTRLDVHDHDIHDHGIPDRGVHDRGVHDSGVHDGGVHDGGVHDSDAPAPDPEAPATTQVTPPATPAPAGRSAPGPERLPAAAPAGAGHEAPGPQTPGTRPQPIPPGGAEHRHD